MAVNPEQWPRTGRRSIAAHDLACALLKAARYALDLDLIDADAKQLWLNVTDPRERASLLLMAETFLERGEMWVESRQYDRQRDRFNRTGGNQ